MAMFCADVLLLLLLLRTGWGKAAAGGSPLLTLTAWGISFQEELDTASFLR